MPFIRQFRIANEEWFDNNKKFKKINKTLKYFLEWEVFQIAMKKYPQWKEGEAPHEIGRAQFGKISIANSDSEAYAYVNAAIDSAWRAVDEQTT